MLIDDATDLVGSSEAVSSRVTAYVCDRLCHVARRRSSASLPSYRAVPTRERVDAAHREIIAAAVHAFRVRGYAATTMSTVAALAGVSPRTLYRYFGSKGELFAAAVEHSTAKFLEQLSARIYDYTLRDAIVGALEQAEIALNGDDREMMRLAAMDETSWRYVLGATSRMQPAFAAALSQAAKRGEPPGYSPDEQFLWDVRAGALLAAITTAYRHWAVTAGLELSNVIATAVDLVLSVGTFPHPQEPPANDTSPASTISKIFN